jgi:acyl dehydratase
MAIAYSSVLELRENDVPFGYTDRDTMLYALAIGLGADPMDRAELPFIYEKELRAVPTLAAVVAWGAGVSTERLGVDYTKVLHGEEETIFHQPMPVSARLRTDSSVIGVYDKGKDKGATIVRQTVLKDESTGQPIATLIRTIVARGDGGFGGPTAAAAVPHAVPTRAPDKMVDMPIRKDQAELYRLCGDRNPLHIDPSRAVKAGFSAPILHGLCTYGMACRAVLQSYCDYDPTRIYRHAVRFSAPVYPGETLSFALWRDDDVVSFEASIKARNVVVLKNGKTVLGAAR